MWAKVVDEEWWHAENIMFLSLAARGMWVTLVSRSCYERDGGVSLGVFTDLIWQSGHGGSEMLHHAEVMQELVDAGLLRHAPGGWDIVGWDDMTFVSDERRQPLDWAEPLLHERDGWSCRNCGATCPGLHIDHIVPRSLGGKDELGNFQWLCPPCNISKADMRLEEWVESGRAAAIAEDSTCRVGQCGHRPGPRADRLNMFWSPL